MLSLVVLSLLIVAGATRSPRPRPLQIYTAPTAPAGTHWKNRPNISRKGVVGRGRGVKILKPIPGATLTGRTIFPRVINFRVGVQTNVQARKVCKDYGNNGNTATGRGSRRTMQAGEPLPPHRRALLTSSADLHTEIFRGLEFARAQFVIIPK